MFDANSERRGKVRQSLNATTGDLCLDTDAPGAHAIRPFKGAE